MPENEQTPSPEEKPSGVTEITRALVAAMGERLDEFARALSDAEQMALATVFGLAGRGLGTFWGSQACIGTFMVALKGTNICVARSEGTSVPRLSESFENALYPGSAGRFAIEGLEVDKTMTGAKSV